jgi:hypothetical protein
LNDGAKTVEESYDRGELTYARFADACPRCRFSRPSGASFLCAKKEMRVFAESTCKEFEPAEKETPAIDAGVRATLYRANLKVEIAVDQHAAVQAKVAAANAGRLG